MKNNIIRKITIGKDYKSDSMHYLCWSRSLWWSCNL